MKHDIIFYGTATGGRFLRSLCYNDNFTINETTGDAHSSLKNNSDKELIEDNVILTNIKFDYYVQIVTSESIADFLAIRLLHINSYSINHAKAIYDSQKTNDWPEFTTNDYYQWPKIVVQDILDANKNHVLKYSKNLNPTNKQDFLIDVQELYKDKEPITITNWLKQVHNKDLCINRLKQYRRINHNIISKINNKLFEKFELKYNI